MTESKVYADGFSCNFKNPDEFLQFLWERKENSSWIKAPSRSLHFKPIEKGSTLGNLYMQIYEHDGRGEILADTMENTSLLVKVNDKDYPVRSCALKTILERARISGHALNKVSTEVFTQILNCCMDVASGDSLVKIADEKVSAVHGGDPKDYGVMEMLPLFQSVKEFLDTQYPGNHFITATFDHSFAMAFWSLDGQSNELLNTYKQELVAKGLTNIETMRPGLRVMTSDVGMSGANLYPIFLMGCANRIIPLGYPIKTEHKSGKGLEYFEEQMQLLYARFNEAIEKQTKLMGIEIRYPQAAMLGVLKRIGVPKKASFETVDQFVAQNGDQPCTAYEIYLAMSEVIFMAQCEGASASRIAQLEEHISRALSVNWREFDFPGDFKW